MTVRIPSPDFGIRILLVLILSAGCGPRRVALPADPGTPLPDFAAVHEQATTACRGVRTLTAELSLRGRAAGQRLGGRLIAGFERPASMRMEAVAPFGGPGFVLAARGDEATLLLPRDARVVRGERTEAILGALTGVELGAADLRAILTGCVMPDPVATAGRLHGNGWASIDLGGGATMFLERADGWRVRAARRPGWQIEYTPWDGTFPLRVRLRSAGGVEVDVTAALTQVEANVDIDPAAFEVEVPAGTEPLSLAALRASGPLGEKE